MADKSWFSRLNPLRANTAEKAAINKLNDVVDDLKDQMSYEVKFWDSEHSSTYGSGMVELANIDQTITARVLQTLYCTETWVYVAVNAIAKTIGGLPWEVQKKKVIEKEIQDPLNPDQKLTVKQDFWVDASGEPVAKLFKRPNAYTSQSEFKMITVIDLLTAGEYFIYLDSDKDLDALNGDLDEPEDSPVNRLRAAMRGENHIKAMYRIPPSIMKVVPKENGEGIEGYVAMTDEGMYAFGCGEIIHVKLPNPLNQYAGLSPLVATFKSVLLDRFSGEHMIRFYKSGARLGGIIETEKSLNKEQLARFQRSFENNFTGRHNHHRTLILPPGMEYKQIEQNPAETALLEFCKYNREAILSTYNVPPIKVGILDNANYANALVQLKIFFTDTIKPYLEFIQDGFSLKDSMFPGKDLYRVEFDLSEVDALKEDEELKSRTAKGMLDSGMTVNEVRKRIWNLGPVKGGDKAPVVENMEDEPFVPFRNLSADKPAEVKEVVPATVPSVTSDIKPTKGTFTERVAELVAQFTAQGLPISASVPKAIEQAKLEGFSDEPAKSLSDNIVADLEKLGDAPVNSQMIQQVMATNGAVVEPEPKKPEAPKTYPFGLSKEHVVANWKSFVDNTNPLIMTRLAAVQKFFADYEKIVQKRWKMKYKSLELPTSKRKSPNDDDVNDVLDSKALAAIIEEYIKEIDATLLKAAEYGFNDALVQFKFDMPNSKASEYLKKYAASRITGIVDTTRDQISKVIAEGFEQNVTAAEIGTRIAEKFAEISIGRALTIARTETLTAVSQGQELKQQEWKSEFPGKPLKKMWVSAQDDSVRDSHADLDGEAVDVDDDFSNGLKFPRDPNGEASEVINCRCSTITYAEEQEESIQETLPKDEG